MNILDAQYTLCAGQMDVKKVSTRFVFAYVGKVPMNKDEHHMHNATMRKEVSRSGNRPTTVIRPVRGVATHKSVGADGLTG